MVTIALRTVQHLVASSSEIEKSTGEWNKTFEHVANAVEEVAISAGKQAVVVENGNDGVLKLNAVMKKNKKLVQEFNEATEIIVTAEKEGIQSVEGLILSSQATDELMQSVQGDIEDTSVSARQITDICKKIQALSNKTNILALNAAIEAARAGEAGKGFTIVAEEVRKLAEQSAQSAKEIDTVAMALELNSSHTVEKMQDCMNAMEAQRTKVEVTKDRFENIMNAIEMLKRNMKNLNATAEELSAFKEEVGNILEDLSAIAQSNAAVAEETTSAVSVQSQNLIWLDEQSKELNRIAAALKNEISSFQV
jgi:methyl-accepting chemotaxis protein